MIAYFHEEDEEEEEDEIRRELNAKLEELAAMNSKNKERVKDLTDKIHLEVKNKTPLYFMNSKEDIPAHDFRNKQVLEKALNEVRMFNRIDLEVEFLKNMILRLDRKQVAESISKITNC